MSEALKAALAEAMRELSAVAAELAIVQETLAGPRMSRRAVRDAVARACVVTEYDRERDTGRVLSWRPPTPEEIARIDAVHERTAPILRQWQPIEAALKQARRSCETDVRRLEVALKNPRKIGAKSARESAQTICRPTSWSAHSRADPAPRKMRAGSAHAPTSQQAGRSASQPDLFSTGDGQ